METLDASKRFKREPVYKRMGARLRSKTKKVNKMSDLQEMWDLLSNIEKDARSIYHVTLGELIDFTKDMDPGSIIHSDRPDAHADGIEIHFITTYRGYYSDLAFFIHELPKEEKNSIFTVGDLHERCKILLDTTLTGYKGGDFLMEESTPLWYEPSDWHGAASEIAIINLEKDCYGNLVFITKELSDD